jgi:hypothetical protein
MFTATAITCGKVSYLNTTINSSELILACLTINGLIMGAWSLFHERYQGSVWFDCYKRSLAGFVSGTLGSGIAGYIMGCYLVLAVNVLATVCDVFLII